MKKFLSILLIFCFALTVGCAKTTEDMSSDSDAGSHSSQQGSYTDVSTDGGITANPLKQQIDSVLSDNSDRTLSSKNLLRGLSYSVSRTASENYPDTTNLLTDGNLPVGFSQDQWAGYYSNSGQGLTVTFDLGHETDGILDFHARVLNLPSYGISICNTMTVSVAGEDKKYVTVGKAHPPKDIGTDDQWDLGVLLQGSVKARYIKYDFSNIASVWLFVGEISCIAYSSEYNDSAPEGTVSGKEYYGSTEPPFVETPSYWSESEPDYNIEQNLIKGKTAQVFSGETFTADMATEWYNTKSTSILTDEKYASLPSYSDTAWFHTTRGATRELVYDLGNSSCISGFSINFLRDSSAGVNLPRNVTILASQNGRDWQTLYIQPSVTATAENAIVMVEKGLDHYDARFVKFRFSVDVHCYVDEIAVKGTKKVPDNANKIVPDQEGENNIFDNEYITPDRFCGVNNMLLSYNCLVDDSNIPTENGFITKDEYLSHVAYLDQNGIIKDTFFDAFLFLPYTAFNYSDYGRSANGWKTYVDNIFTPDRNMDALDQCVELVGDALSIDNYKVKVFTPILYTFRTLNSGAANPFGDIDGDGKDEDFSRIEDRKKAIKWIMDEEFKRFKSGGYGHLDFCGFYWFEEAITYSDPHETELIRYASDYAHKLGVKLFWIPYQRASGYSDWKELGFDLACMQPNYMFQNSFTSDILYDNAQTTKLYGMCVELEINDPRNKQDASRYAEYLIAGAQTGYMNAVKIYYQGGVPGAFHTACYSEDPSVRKIYDDTYLFAKEQYVAKDMSGSSLSDGDVTLTCQKDNSVSSSFDLTGKEGGIVEIEVSPKYGSVQVNLDGTYTYFAPKEFFGEDCFYAVLDFGHSKSAPTKVTVTVG